MQDDAWQPTLRYFACRSRGQALRFALGEAGVEFTDERVPLEELDAFRRAADDPAVGGPFGSLPVLAWEGHQLGQTLAIARYLAGRCDPHESEDELARARLDMVAHAAHLDLQVPYSQLLWLPADTGRDRLEAAARLLLEHLGRHLARLERILPEGKTYFGGNAPAVADSFVFESLLRGLDVFGRPFTERLERLPGLAALCESMAARPRIAAQCHLMPVAVTASPSEAELRIRIRS